MKKSLFLLVMSLLLTSLNSIAQLAPITLPNSAEEWSAPQAFTLITRDGYRQKVDISTRLVKHQGTTGFIDVKIANYGPKDIVRMYVGLIKGPVDLKNYKGLNYNNCGIYSIRNGYNTTMKLELRECHPKGASKMSDLENAKAANRG
ncbi:hypothetical protein BCY91_05675 [Pelobium manganitolerans]|uniref:Uncharacterized protein n=1 Tax=Pelobium manganitolerans TaxID=1842495 RepID=A0A419S4K8_9SPHI|nr:hypothetical protein [Pelobium manganitolerans]RKD15021.1 hypothetical protein BCY91_05675 [Pelobium manganitolerans]